MSVARERRASACCATWRACSVTSSTWRSSRPTIGSRRTRPAAPRCGWRRWWRRRWGGTSPALAVYGRHGQPASATQQGDRHLLAALGRRGGRPHGVLRRPRRAPRAHPSRAQPGQLTRAGALRAARFIAGARPGLYSMQDVLGLGMRCASSASKAGGKVRFGVVEGTHVVGVRRDALRALPARAQEVPAPARRCCLVPWSRRRSWRRASTTATVAEEMNVQPCPPSPASSLQAALPPRAGRTIRSSIPRLLRRVDFEAELAVVMKKRCRTRAAGARPRARAARLSPASTT